MSNTPKALLSFSVIADHDDNPRGPKFPAVPVRSDIKLYPTYFGSALEWRIGGWRGDPVEGMPRITTLKQAKLDAVAMYGRGAGPWYARASWM